MATTGAATGFAAVFLVSGLLGMLVLSGCNKNAATNAANGGGAEAATTAHPAGNPGSKSDTGATAAAVAASGTGESTNAETAAMSEVERIKANVPQPPEGEPVRGIYVSGWITGGTKRWGQLLDLIDRTELNAVVIDAREDGELSFDMDIPLAKELKSSAKMIANIDDKMAQLRKRNIYPIARIVCFRDQVAAKKRPDLAVQKPDGSPWRDGSGHYWLDPYNKTNWEYITDVAVEAAKHGFGEIQFDYVRFPSEGGLHTMRFPAKEKDDARSKARVIASFLEYAYNKLKPYGVVVSADIFGLTVSARPDDDMGIGQKVDLMAEHLDYICPMIYPSHYNKGEYGIPNPNAAPYKTVHKALDYATTRMKGKRCKIRPWLQDFTLGYRYGPAEVKAQMKAAREFGINEFLFWNAGNRYTASAFAPAKKKTDSKNGTSDKDAATTSADGTKKAENTTSDAKAGGDEKAASAPATGQ